MTRPSSADALRALAVAASLATTAHASAQAARDPALAESLFRSGQDALAKDDWATACTKFQASMDSDPAVSTLLNIAKCDAHAGKLALAWADYQKALVLNRETVGDKRRADLEAYTRKAIEALEPRIPKLRIVVKSPPAGLAITRDGQAMPIGALGEPVPVDPGPHTLVLTAPGFKEATRAVVLEEGKTLDVNVALEAAPAAPLAPTSTTSAPPPPPPPPLATTSGGVPAWAWVAGGVGLAAAAAGVAFAVDGASAVSTLRSNCQDGPDGKLHCAQSSTVTYGDWVDGLNARKNRDLPLSIAFDVVGAAGLVVAIVGIATAKPSSPQKGALPTLVLGRGGAGLGGRF